jgi:DNA-binding GntR family transcriptional regulator
MQGAGRLESWRATADRLCAEHQGILDAVGSGDAAAARRAVSRHILGFYEETGLAPSADRSS